MSTSDATLERPIRPQAPQPRAVTPVTGSKKKATPASPLGNLALYIVPHLSEDRKTAIAEAAYLKAQLRGFAPGHELEDWLAAENEIEQRLAGEGRAF